MTLKWIAKLSTKRLQQMVIAFVKLHIITLSVSPKSIISGTTEPIVVIKMAPIGTRTQNCFSLVRRSAGLSIPGRDCAVYLFVHCAHFIALSMSFHWTLSLIMYVTSSFPNFRVHNFIINAAMTA